jgi:hypothetical protein
MALIQEETGRAIEEMVKYINEFKQGIDMQKE